MSSDVIVDHSEEKWMHIAVTGKYLCQHCGLIDSTKEAIEAHFKQTHEKYVCADCGEAFAIKILLKLHTKECGKPIQLPPKTEAMKEEDSEGGSNSLYVPVPGPTMKPPTAPAPAKEAAIPWVKLADGRCQCIACDKIFAEKSSVYRHYRIIHLKRLRYQCPECGMTFGQSHQVRNHMNRNHRDKTVPSPTAALCTICGKVLSEKRKLRVHMATIHGVREPAAVPKSSYIRTEEGHVMCEDCGETFAMQGLFEEHYRSKHMDETPEAAPAAHEFRSFKCSIKSCGKEFSSITDLNLHREATHPIERRECPTCGKMVSANPKDFKKHMQIHSDGYNRMVTCTLCGKEMRSGYMKRHRLNEHTMIDCSRGCGRQFKYRDKAAKLKHESECDGHSREVVEEKVPLPPPPPVADEFEDDSAPILRFTGQYRCTFCPPHANVEHFPKMSNLYQHLHKAHQISEFQVGEANKVMEQVDPQVIKEAEKLVMQLDAPEPDRPARFSCSACGLSYSSHKKVVRHVIQAKHLSGVGQPMFPCEFCDRAYQSLGSLNRHISQSHTVEFPYNDDFQGHLGNLPYNNAPLQQQPQHPNMPYR